MAAVKPLARKRGYLVYVLRLLLLPVLLVSGIELALRLFTGMPTGLFCPLFPGPNGLYPPNRRMILDYGLVPYVIETNSLGLRGPEISVRKPPGVFRIAELGDSMTDGFFVDNDATFPFLLQQRLQQQGYHVEVINAAHGGGTITTEYAILRDHVLALEPDLVMLNWTPNDLGDMQSGAQASDAGLVSGPRASLGWLVCHSAIVEGMLDAYLRNAAPKYRWLTRKAGQVILDDRRYQIPGNDDFAQNAQLTLNAAVGDGQVIVEPFTPKTHALIQSYLDWLRRMEQALRDRGIKFVFVYHPAYSQVYVPDSSMLIRNILRDECGRLGVPFFDLTLAFRDRGKQRPLDMAPMDYHLNPYGNQATADALADLLRSANLLPAP